MRCACGTLTVLGSWCSASLFCSGEDMGFLCIVGRLCGPPDRHACFHLSKPRVGLEQVRGRGVRRHVLCVSSNRSYRSCPPWTERKKQGELAHRRRASVLARAAPQKERTAVIKQIPRRWNEEIQGDLFPRHTAQGMICFATAAGQVWLCALCVLAARILNDTNARPLRASASRDTLG